MAGSISVSDVHAMIDACAGCGSERVQYEFRSPLGPLYRCLACTLLFRRGEVGRADRRELSERAAERMLHARKVTGIAGRALIIVPAGDGAEVGDADVVDADAFVRGNVPQRTYELCIVVDALDRVDDPLRFLDRLRDATSENGAASLTMQNAGSSAARYAGPAWRGFAVPALRFYTVDTLQCELSRAGFGEARFFVDGTLRPGSLRVRGAARALHAIRLRGAAARTQTAARLLDEAVTAIVRRGAPMSNHVLSVIVPVFNERATFRELMTRLLAKTIPEVDIEIIVVESNSSDGSREEVLAFAGHRRVDIVLQDQPRGKGNAVRAGLSRARGDIVLFQDADLEYDIDDYDDLVRPIVAYQRNFVIGSRHGRKGSAWKIRDFNDAPVLSQVFNLGHVIFLNLLNGIYGERMDDPFSMFKVFRRDCIAGLTFECDRFDFDFEIVIKLLRKGYRPLEIPVNYHSRSIAEGKKVTMVRDPLTWLRALARFRTAPLYEADRDGSSRNR